jgi:AraC-like DNA-binding protein
MGQKIEIAEPSDLFKPFIQYYKYIETDLTGLFRIVPIPYVELYFNFTRLNLFSPEYYDLGFPRIHLAGLHHYDQVAYSNMFGTERNGGFCIVFRPRGFFNLFRIKSSEFSKYCITGDVVFRRDIDYLWEKLSSCSEIKSMKEVFESFFSGSLTGHQRDNDLLDHVVGRMDKTGGMTRVSELCNIYNITPRSLERHFIDEIGIPAKELLQIFRINRAIRMLAEKPDVNLAGLSYLSGYFDQSHFIRDIRKITGISPGLLQASETGRKTVHNRLFIKNQ